MSRTRSGERRQLDRVEANEASVSLGLERLVFFSDAIFAISITLLAIELVSTFDEGSTDMSALLSRDGGWSYLLSFLVVGLFWLDHHRKFACIRHYNGNLLLSNLLLLMVITLVPLPTKLLANHRDQAVPVGIYAAFLGLVGVASLASWSIASRGGRLTDPAVSHQTIKRETLISICVPVLFGLSAVGVFSRVVPVSWARGLWLVILVVSLLGHIRITGSRKR